LHGCYGLLQQTIIGYSASIKLSQVKNDDNYEKSTKTDNNPAESHNNLISSVKLLNINSLESISQALLPSIHNQKKLLLSEMAGIAEQGAAIKNSTSINTAPTLSTKQETILYESYIETLLVYLIATNGIDEFKTHHEGVPMMDEKDDQNQNEDNNNHKKEHFQRFRNFYTKLFYIPCIALETYTTTGAVSTSLSLLSYLLRSTPLLVKQNTQNTQSAQNVNNSIDLSDQMGHSLDLVSFLEVPFQDRALIQAPILRRMFSQFTALLGDTKRTKLRKTSLMTLYMLLFSTFDNYSNYSKKIKHFFHQKDILNKNDSSLLLELISYPLLGYLDLSDENIRGVIDILNTMSDDDLLNTQHITTQISHSPTQQSSDKLRLFYMARDCIVLIKSNTQIQLYLKQLQREQIDKSLQSTQKENLQMFSEDE